MTGCCLPEICMEVMVVRGRYTIRETLGEYMRQDLVL